MPDGMLFNSTNEWCSCKNAEIYNGENGLKYTLYSVGDKQAIKDSNGKQIISPEYDVITPLGDYNTLLAKAYIVTKDNKMGLFDVNGKVLLEPIYDSIQTCGFGNIQLDSTCSYNFFNPNRETESMDCFHNLFDVEKDGRHGIYDFNKQKFTIDIKYEKAFYYKYGENNIAYIHLTDTIGNTKVYKKMKAS